MRTYIYEVTSSNDSAVPVGTLLVDTEDKSARGEPRTWHVYRPGTGGIVPAWSGTCLHRVCTGCRTLGVLRLHRHAGSCGPAGFALLLTPVRISTEDPYTVADGADRLAAMLDEEPQHDRP